MNKEEKSLLDELFDAAGLNDQKQPAPSKEQESTEIPQKNEITEENQQIIAETDPIPDNTPKKEQISKSEAENPSKESVEPKDHTTKKKDIKFLVIYTIVFVVVISSLIGGSYVITSRIHHQMAENNQDLNTSQSTLKNIQDENTALKQENAVLKAENEALSTSAEDANALLESVGDMVEQDGYLTAAQNAYIDGDRAGARTLMAAIDREKLSQPAKEYYDLLKDKLGL